MDAKIEEKLNIGGLYNQRETAEFLRCCRTKLYHLRKAGKIESIKSGEQVLYSGSAIMYYLTKNREVVES